MQYILCNILLIQIQIQDSIYYIEIWVIYNKYQSAQRTIFRMSVELINLLKNTLNPSQIQSTQRAITNSRNNQGFATDLMIIADNINLDINVRQSALVVLKNLFYDQCTQGNIMNKNDYQVIKQNILEALIRAWGQKQLTPTLREIIHLIAEKDYPNQWPQIVDNCLNYICNPTDFNTVASSVQALKAVTSICGGSIDHQITLNNLCNKIVFPLFELANRLFQNFSTQTLPILISIFKIFNLAIFYHLPLILINNIHSLMIFIKKILDLQGMNEIVPLKTVCLKILSRLYIRHTNSKTVSYKLLSFAQQFHNRYSCPMIETMINQLNDPNNQQQILGLSLNCLANIYRNNYNENSINLINSYSRRIIETCLNRYKITGMGKKIGKSVGSYITCIKEQRNSLVDFVGVLINEDTSLLGEFINALTSGDDNVQELSLYIFSALAEEVEDIPDLHTNMCQFIINYIIPILANQSTSKSSIMLKSRGCQIISHYIYIDLPEDQLQQIFKFIYSCLTEINEIYLNIYALEAFTKLIVKYQQFIQFIIPCLEGILKKYTELMKQSHGEIDEVIKSFESFLGELDGKDLEPYAVNLVGFLTSLFYQYDNTSPNENNDDDQQDNALVNACQGCLACIRKIIASDNISIQSNQHLAQQCLFSLIVDIFSDKELVYFEQALNILNLIIYKAYRSSVMLPEKYVRLFPIFIYSILGLPQGILAQNNINASYKTMLENICGEPDEDIIFNTIGVLRNYIAKLGTPNSDSLRSLTTETNSVYLEQVIKVVKYVHTGYNQQQQKFIFKKSDRLTILTLYTTLIEHRIINQTELTEILRDFQDWANRVHGPQRIPYFENILVAINFYGNFVFQVINCSWFINQLTANIHLFINDYQMQRLIIGVSKMIEIEAFANNNTDIIRYLPEILIRYYRMKNKDNTLQASQQLIDEQQQAIEDQIAENTHLGLMTSPHNKQQQEKKNEIYEKICEQIQWDQEYNKYYYSPIDSINEIQYLGSTLRNSPLFTIIPPHQQSQLTQIFSNAGLLQ